MDPGSEARFRVKGQMAQGTGGSAVAVRACAGGVSIEALVSAGAADSKVRGLHGNALKVAVRAPPEKGKANAEVEELLAAFLGVGKTQVAVVAGQTSRHKRLVVAGISVAQAEERIRALGS